MAKVRIRPTLDPRFPNYDLYYSGARAGNNCFGGMDLCFSFGTATSSPDKGLRFAMNDRVTVLDGDLTPVVPGSGTIGRLAQRRHVPLGYYNDPEKTAATFYEIDGEPAVLKDFDGLDIKGEVVTVNMGPENLAMKHLATRPDTASVSAREIAEQYDIPIELMAKVLQRLARRGLLESHQGTRGGYQLSRPPSAISVADVIQAVDGPLTVTACST